MTPKQRYLLSAVPSIVIPPRIKVIVGFVEFESYSGGGITLESCDEASLSSVLTWAVLSVVWKRLVFSCGTAWKSQKGLLPFIVYIVQREVGSSIPDGTFCHVHWRRLPFHLFYTRIVTYIRFQEKIQMEVQKMKFQGHVIPHSTVWWN